MAAEADDLNARDRRIRQLAAGDPDRGIPRVSHSTLAKRFNVSRPRITQIVHQPVEQHRIGELHSLRKLAAERLASLERRRREIERDIRIVRALLRDYDDELIVRANDRILGFP
jgi:hypothetical protein